MSTGWRSAHCHEDAGWASFESVTNDIHDAIAS
jgi:hypothetical protein